MSAPNATEKLPDLSVEDGSQEVGGPRTYGEDPGPLAARYIQACHSQSWHFAHWSKTDVAEPVKWQPMRCCSWRHEGPCQRFRAAQDYARIAKALEERNREHVVYIVLTLDPSAWTGDGWLGWDGETPERRADATKDQSAISAAFDALSERWHVFKQGLKRRFGKIEYVSTVEVHRSGWPHLNVIVVNEELANFCQVASQALDGWDKNAKGRETARRVFGTMLQSSGFGPIAFLEKAGRKSENGDQLAGYIAKLASSSGEAWDGKSRGLLEGQKVSSLDGQAIAEVVKYSQVPHDAPKNHRRIRSSKGFLPPIEKDPDRTGGIFDAGMKPIGNMICDDILEDAKASDPAVHFQRVMARIGEELAKLDMRQEWVGDDTGALAKKQDRIIRTLLHAAKLMHGEDVGAWKREEQELEERLREAKWKQEHAEQKKIWAERKRRLKESGEELKRLMREKGIAI